VNSESWLSAASHPPGGPASFHTQLQQGAYLRSQADAAVAQDFEAQPFLLQSQLEYPQAQDELTDAIGQTAE